MNKKQLEFKKQTSEKMLKKLNGMMKLLTNTVKILITLIKIMIYDSDDDDEEDKDYVNEPTR